MQIFLFFVQLITVTSNITHNIPVYAVTLYFIAVKDALPFKALLLWKLAFFVVSYIYKYIL